MTTKQSRPGSRGRKPGSRNRPKIPAHTRAKELAYRALDSDDTPLEIMLEAARFFVNEARRIRQLDGMVEVQVQPAEAEGGTPKVEARTAHGMYMAAAECAKKAAPYVHPTLSSTEVKVNRDFEAAVLTVDEAMRRAAEPGDDSEEKGKPH